jgi:hypothetical protein
MLIRLWDWCSYFLHCAFRLFLIVNYAWLCKTMRLVFLQFHSLWLFRVSGGWLKWLCHSNLQNIFLPPVVATVCCLNCAITWVFSFCHYLQSDKNSTHCSCPHDLYFIISTHVSADWAPDRKLEKSVWTDRNYYSVSWVWNWGKCVQLLALVIGAVPMLRNLIFDEHFVFFFFYDSVNLLG